MTRKLRAPIDVHISAVVRKRGGGLGGHEHKLFFHEEIDFQPRSMLWRVHDGGVDEPSGGLID